ncbi:hypothetical protein FOCC_FOCC016305 [Frankliniella occidentalis]|nr:hypothetical protein FOCC_FOCC016305 [Frankliniella occidentalis]
MNRHQCALIPSQNNSIAEVELVKAHPSAKSAVLEATAEFCATDLRALSVVEGEGFRALAQTLILVGERYGKVDVEDLLSAPKTIKRRINQLAEAERADLYPRVQAAAEAEELACTLDMWLDSKKRSIMTCNVSFPELNAETNIWEAKTYNYFTEPFPQEQSKSAENLRAFIVKMFAKRGVSEDKLVKVCFVTDGEAALQNALSDWWREYCTAHACNIVYTHAMTLAPKDFQSLPPTAETLAKNVEEIVADLRKLRTQKLGKAAISDAKLAFPKSFARANCIAFISDNYLKVRQVLTKAKATKTLELLELIHAGQVENLTTSLKPYMEIRWNSFHRMLSSIQKVYAELQVLFERKNDGVPENERNTKLEAVNKDLLDDMVCLLTPMKVESELVQAKYSVTAPLPLVSYHKLRAAYSPQEGDTDVIRVMRARLFSELQQVVKVTMTHKLATFLEPSFRGFRNMLTEEEKTKNPKPLAWWSQRAGRFPRLARLARRYLVIPATSAESERTFSDAGWILNKRRKNLEIGVLDDLLFSHCNYKAKIRAKMQRLRSSLFSASGKGPNENAALVDT